jgi:type IV secretion system protein VirD4
MIASQLLTSNDGDNKTLDSILMNVANYLEVFKNEFIRNLTAQNDINFNELIEKPLALFIIMPDENSNYSKLISLLISQIYQFLVELANKNQNKSLKRPTYFILDEFGNIPKINNMEKIITIARSRNIYFQLILQDISLLDILYGKDIRRIILNNCGLHIFLHTNDLETAKYYSELFGEETILQVGTSEIKDNTSLSKNLKGKSLISASELLNLPTGVGIAKISRENPIKINLTF